MVIFCPEIDKNFNCSHVDLKKKFRGRNPGPLLTGVGKGRKGKGRGEGIKVFLPVKEGERRGMIERGKGTAQKVLGR